MQTRDVDIIEIQQSVKFISAIQTIALGKFIVCFFIINNSTNDKTAVTEM